MVSPKDITNNEESKDSPAYLKYHNPIVTAESGNQETFSGDLDEGYSDPRAIKDEDK